MGTRELIIGTPDNALKITKGKTRAQPAEAQWRIQPGGGRAAPARPRRRRPTGTCAGAGGTGHFRWRDLARRVGGHWPMPTISGNPPSGDYLEAVSVQRPPRGSP